MAKEVFHTCRSAGRTFTEEEWREYLKQGWKDESKRIVTQIGRYDFNDCDICLNPSVMVLQIGERKFVSGYYVVIEWCECGNGLWSYGLCYSYGYGGGCSGCGYADRPFDGSHKNHYGEGFPSEKEAKKRACDQALDTLRYALNQGTSNNTEGVNAKISRLIAMVEDYRKEQARPKQLELFKFD